MASPVPPAIPAPPRLRSPLAAAVLLLCAGLLPLMGCSEENDLIVVDIGTLRVLFTSPALGPQTLKDADRPAQAVSWDVTMATLTVDGQPIDLLLGEECAVVDTVLTLPSTDQKCGGGLVIDSRDEPVEATLDVEFTMRIARGEPVLLGGDTDGDGVPDGQDNCPLIPNADQDVTVCSFIDDLTGAFVSDSDGDTVPDGIDNCLWTPNPEQTNSGGMVSGDADDLIGDDCVEQVADVQLDGSATIRVLGVPILFSQPRNMQTLIVVAIDHRNALSCDYSAGTCVLDRNAIGFCQQESLAGAIVGCPE